MALDGGNYDAKDRDRKMAEEARGVRETMSKQNDNKNNNKRIDSTNYDDYSSYFDGVDDAASTTGGDPYKRSKKPTISISSKKASDAVASTPGLMMSGGNSNGDYFSSSTSGGDYSYSPPRQRSQKEILAALSGITQEEAGHL